MPVCDTLGTIVAGFFCAVIVSLHTHTSFVIAASLCSTELFIRQCFDNFSFGGYNSNSGSETFADSPGSAHDGVGDDNHVAIVVRIRGSVHRSALSGGVQTEWLPWRQWEWRVASWAGRGSCRLLTAGGDCSWPAAELILWVPCSADTTCRRAGCERIRESAEWTVQNKMSWWVSYFTVLPMDVFILLDTILAMDVNKYSVITRSADFND